MSEKTSSLAAESRLQFQVGLVVLLAFSCGTALVARFGGWHRRWEPHYAVTVQLPTAGGLYPSAPVQMHGLRIGRVTRLKLVPAEGVLAEIEVQQQVSFPVDTQATITKSLLGETSLEIVPGRASDPVLPGGRIVGNGGGDPMEMVQRLESRAVQLLDSLQVTSQEWQKVATNVNGLMSTNRGQIDVVIERTAESLHQFSLTMQTAQRMMASADQLVGDPQTQAALKATLTQLPVLVQQTEATIRATRQAVGSMHANLENLARITEPAADRGEQLVAKLDSSLQNLDLLLSELQRFAKAANNPDGSLQKFANDPQLYDNLNRSSLSMAVLLRNVEPLLKDFREFSDKIARNPELLGVGGAMRPSAGLRDAELLDSNRSGTPNGRSASSSRPATTNRPLIRSQN